jgi:hypothetical protein
LHDGRRLRVWVHPDSHHFEGGYSGDFLERARFTVTNVGLQLRSPRDVPPLDFCLRTLLRELVCEREPLNHPQIERLNSEQLGRYVWAPYSGNSITPEAGEVLNLCEALRWYCQRLIGLLDLPSDRAEAPSGKRPSPKERVDACRRRLKIRSYEKFAAKVGISKDTLYAITKEARWVSDQIYELVGEFCGCKPEDLYPRDIPRPDRRPHNL